VHGAQFDNFIWKGIVFSLFRAEDARFFTDLEKKGIKSKLRNAKAEIFQIGLSTMHQND